MDTEGHGGPRPPVETKQLSRLVTSEPVGVVEPMRTEDAHQGRGLARHVLTSGIELLVQAGAERIKICFEPDNPASSHLYPSVGFVPGRRNDMCSGPTGVGPHERRDEP